jgi:UDP-N-acetylmuramoyl-tripeptide--D-alanyl-D-alanine ligase
MRMTLHEVAEATGGRIVAGSSELPFTAIGIDTRALPRGALFVAIRGAHFDGHDFVGDAVAAGAAGVVVRRGTNLPAQIAAVEVEGTERALGDLASWWRTKLAAPCVAITGSNGKSTTKEMAAAAVGALGPIVKTEGNFNNLIGLPLTIFRWEEGHRAAILEMGMNAPGEIRRLTEIARPGVGLITNVTAAHLERLHSVEAVAAAKGELFESMPEGGIAVVNAEDRWVQEVAASYRGEHLTYGMRNDCAVRFLHMETNGLDAMLLALAVRGKDYRVKLPVPGAHNVMNALAAVAVGVALGIDAGIAVERLSGFRPMALRFERLQLANGARVVNDAYNANPESMRAAFRTVGSAARAGRFVAALGDMLELGEASAELHRQVGEDAVQQGVERLFVIGDFAEELAAGAQAAGLSDSEIAICDDVEQLSRLVEEELHAGDVLLVKGSRGMRMERVVEYLKAEIGTG